MAELVVKDAEKWFRREDGNPLKLSIGCRSPRAPAAVTVLIGPSGCGKSTLLNSIVGLEKLDRGELQFLAEGKNQARPLIGYVFQSPRLLPWKTIGENLAARLEGRRRGARRLGDAGIEQYLAARRPRRIYQSIPAVFSGGQRQRVGLARALAIESDVVLDG